VNEVMCDGLFGRKVIEQSAFGESAQGDHIVDARGAVSAGVENSVRFGEDCRSGSDGPGLLTRFRSSGREDGR
jgi:hypothetical protein